MGRHFTHAHSSIELPPRDVYYVLFSDEHGIFLDNGLFSITGDITDRCPVEVKTVGCDGFHAPTVQTQKEATELTMRYGEHFPQCRLVEVFPSTTDPTTGKKVATPDDCVNVCLPRWEPPLFVGRKLP